MGIKTDQQLAVTLEKLRGLEEHYQTAREATASNERVAQLSLRSMSRMINQMKEEIARYHAGIGTVRESDKCS